MPETCPSSNQQAIDQSTFWSPDGINWDAHRIGWAIAGGCSAVTVLVTMISVYRHARHYTCPPEQRQIIRILYLPPVYAVISFLSYRFFRSYTYYALVEVVYEAITLSAFLLLIIEYVSATASGHSAKNALARKDKQKLFFPFCCWRFRPTKPYFMYSVKWAVMQYVIFRPLISAIAVVCQKYNVLCEDGGFNIHFAYAYLTAFDFVSISVALYGLLLFYGITKDELKGRRPLAKFLCIKLIVMFTYYQSFVFSILESTGRIKATQYWTTTNIVDGLNALTICIEMILFALGMMWAYPASEYMNGEKTRIWRALWDSINISDFFAEIYSSLKFFVDYMRGKPGTKSSDIKRMEGRKMDFGEAFGLTDDDKDYLPTTASDSYNKPTTGGGGGGFQAPNLPRLRSGSGPSNRQLDAYDGANERLTGPRMASVDMERSPDALSPQSAGYVYPYPGAGAGASRGGSDESTSAEQIGMQPLGSGRQQQQQAYGRGSSATRF